MIFFIAYITSSTTTAKFLFRFLESILLPSVFLKNTDKNREQVIEQGWLAFFCNTFNFCNLSSPCSAASDVIILDQIKTNSKEDIFIVSKRIPQNDINDNDAKQEKIRTPT